MLVLQVLKNRKVPYVVHAQYSESRPYQGGHLSRVHLGGSFMGFTFEELCEMGTGEYEVAALDPHDFRNTGTEPEFQSAWEAKHAQFEFILFGYQVGSYTSLEVLAFAQDTLEARRAGEA
ncbi:hypothetical protein [Jeongeupia naejangsanensis]|uniref:Uncharacterized protein n=1 Tax=Jeongeupia naejangsanensis TaxID=613195 RepID=A0ABS2BKC7_9NEIS|nr:hypothetical protein [Jeongeupia naejangsanensis]MBM3116067.1 hypothetical protein [Jeongeupia naejangsanensis]